MLLDDRFLREWTTCLTQNFVPNYQNIFGPGPGLQKTSTDFIAKYKNSKFNLKRFQKKFILDFSNLAKIIIWQYCFRSTQDLRTPAVYIGEFDAADSSADTFLKMDKFTKVNNISKTNSFVPYVFWQMFYSHKGVALVRSNDRVTNLGRYWPNTGPQVTLYTPGVFISASSRNTVALIEFESSTACESPENCYVEFIDYPIIDSIPPTKHRKNRH